PSEPLFARPSAFSFKPRSENPTERIMREQHEMKVRDAFKHGLAPPFIKLRGSEYDMWEGLDAAGRRTATWFYEWDQNRVVYGPNTPESNAMRDAFRVNEAREYFYKKNTSNINEGAELERVTNYSGSFYAFGKIPVGIVRAGRDMTEQFVGSYCI